MTADAKAGMAHDGLLCQCFRYFSGPGKASTWVVRFAWAGWHGMLRVQATEYDGTRSQKPFGV